MFLNRKGYTLTKGVIGDLFLKNKLLSFREIVLSAILLVFLASNGFATTYYVSSAGNDNNSGTSSSQAWRTLEKVNSFSPSPGDQILFNRGDQWVGTLTINVSGSSGNPIVFGAYGTGEKPKIYNSTAVSGWSVYSGNIYRASISAQSIDRVFINDNPVRSARYPNSGYFKISSVNSSTQFKSTAINGEIDYSGSVIVFRDKEWSTSTSTVTSSSSQTINISQAPLYSLNTGEGFVLLNNLKYLDAAGEWYYDKNSKYLYLWTPNGDSPENYTVRASVLENAVVINSKNYITLENIEFLHSNGNGITMGDCDYITIKNCEISYPDNIGVEISSGSAKNLTFTNNTIIGANHDGIKAYGTYHTFEDNTIKNIGLFENFGVGGLGSPQGKRGIIILGEHSKVRYNHIENIGYNGIGFFAAPYTVIEYNYIKNTCLTTQDGGGIYCYNTSTSDPGCQYSEIRGNIIDNVPGNTEGCTSSTKQGAGIYMDDRIHHITIENNTIARSSYYAIFLHNNRFISVSNNTVYDNGSGYRATGSFGASDNSIKNNIILNIASSGSTSKATLGILNSNESSIVDINNNKYIDKHRDTPFANTKDYSYKTYAQWKSVTGHDGNSTFDGTPLDNGKTEKLIYNNTKQAKTFNLGSSVYLDVDGNPISGTITLQPFTSKILIGTNAENINTNQRPEIQNQFFEIDSHVAANTIIGQLVANDPDEQTLNYSITGGNSENLFYIDSKTGEIFANTDIYASADKTIELFVTVIDDATDPLSASATVTINIFAVVNNDETNASSDDLTAPVISAFSVPEITSSLEIPVLTFEASDNKAITGYLITESENTPAADDQNWSASVPDSYTFTSSGSFELFAWTKDEAGNVSNSISALINVVFQDNSSPFSEYLFEEASGATVIDSKGSNDGSIINEENRCDGANAGGLQFTGKGHINLGHCFCEVQDQLTLSAWVKPDATYTDYQGVIMHGGPNDDTYAMYINSAYKRIAFKTTGTTSAAWFFVDNIDIWDGE
ncbi:right-handed parallel beta-helix repeat-containing protein, partial [Maribellus maritimus]|uniref:right-handed parallel beta-helix repeat-containing protein n=1 Tax=Maribellus maritimus TaxID=2870838 RepID=UPI001EEB49EE